MIAAWSRFSQVLTPPIPRNRCTVPAVGGLLVDRLFSFIGLHLAGVVRTFENLPNPLSKWINWVTVPILDL